MGGVQTPAPQPTLDVGKAFAFVFDDPDWVKKVLLGGLFGLLSVVIIGIPILFGYHRRTFLALVDDPNARLPEWDPGRDLSEGLLVWLAVLCFTIPPAIVAALFSLIPCVGICVAVPISLAVAVCLPAAQTRVMLEYRFEAVFDLAWVFAYVQQNLGNYLLGGLVFFLAHMVAGVAGVLLCLVGLLFTNFWAMLVQDNLLAQIYRGHRDRGSAATPAAGA